MNLQATAGWHFNLVAFKAILRHEPLILVERAEVPVFPVATSVDRREEVGSLIDEDPTAGESFVPTETTCELTRSLCAMKVRQVVGGASPAINDFVPDVCCAGVEHVGNADVRTTPDVARPDLVVRHRADLQVTIAKPRSPSYVPAQKHAPPSPSGTRTS